MNDGTTSDNVTVCEVGPRDGLQMAKTRMATADKIRWVRAIAAAGVPEIEVGSFVPARVIPSMADTGEVVRAVRDVPALVLALAPNLKGAQLAAEAGARRVSIPVSVSEGHSRANTNRSTAEAVAEVGRVAAWVKESGVAMEVEVGLSTAFGCSIDGVIPERRAVEVAEAVVRAGASAVALSDTVGYAHPAQVRALVRATRAAIGEHLGGLHLHDTMGLGLANALAGLEEGIRAFDASLAGLGGCPYAPGASGNIVTEDLVFMLESMGMHTGIDIEKLLAARAVLAEALPAEERHGGLARAGLPKTFRVVELAHMIMGPTVGLVLADLGADVIKVEPEGEGGKPGGDNTRRLQGAGTGFFAIMNRNKRSFTADLKSPEGIAAVRALLREADVLVENFRPGALDKLGLGWEALRAENPRLIYCSCKGFLPGPYEHRVALDEVVQMMGGLAYMTGLPGKPMRAGSSVNDILGGTFAALGILAAALERERTGRGKHVQSGLFETNAVLVAQHMAQKAISGQEPPPMGVRRPAWPIYDVFTCGDGGQVFVGVVTDTQWRLFLDAFGLHDLAVDPALATQAQRVAGRDRVVPAVAEALSHYDAAALMAKCEELGLPFAPIARPWDLFDDPHLRAGGGLVPLVVPESGTELSLPALPLSFDGERLAQRRGLPRVGEHTAEILAELGTPSGQS